VSAFLLGCAAVLAVSLALGLVRLSRGPDVVDRLAAAQLVGTVGVAILLILAEVTGDASLRLVALLFALLGAVTVATFLRVTPVETGTASK
jgi:multicomponent Na+:H+ antiporter subunit F